MFTFGGQRWFARSGWVGDTNVEQNLYIARMSTPTNPTGARYVISQPRESWERVVGNPYMNEAPEAIKDPDGRLRIVYSANGSWRTSTASRTCACAPVANRPTCGTGTSPTAASSARTARR
ncbi:hypothetical protein OG439_24690 [Amycolatopsis sp. NBC_01307]|uniref:hypothetical protein n=1 Tax=Amycolatopsis sp. NBC_01307 TaxID=2903561 RepID=UPI002E1118F8|nr:hypothetical protein OG439_24690 [Amycolatopsis sp. NBC_01307]